MGLMGVGRVAGHGRAIVAVVVVAACWSGLCAGATVALAADPPVKNVTCGVGDDGAGSTSVVLGASGPSVTNDGQHPPTTPCGESATVSPPDSQLSGTCAPTSDPCSGNAAASATAGTTASVSSTGPSTITASASGTASAQVSGTQSGPEATAAQTLGGEVGFTVTTPASFTVSASTSLNAPAFSASVVVAQLSGPGTTFTVTSGSNSTTGRLAPGSYLLDAFIDARANAAIDLSDPSRATQHITASSSLTLTITPDAPGCPADAVPSVQVGHALAEGCFSERADAQGNPTGVFTTDQEAWIGGFDLVPNAGGALVVEPANQSDPVRAEGAGVGWALSPSLSVPAPLSELKPFTPSFSVSTATAGFVAKLLALPVLKSASGQVTVTWSAGGAGAKLDAQVSLADLSKSIGTIAGGTLGTLAASASVALANNVPLHLAGATLDLPEFAVELKDTKPQQKLGFGGAKFAESDDASGKPQWSGQVKVLFPWASRQGSVTAGVSVDDGQISTMTLGLAGFEIPIGETGFDWTAASGTVGLQPRFALDLGIDTQEHATIAGQPLFALSGRLKALQLATDCKAGSNNNPYEFLLTGNSPVLEKAKIGSLALTVRFCAYVPSAANFAFEANVGANLDVDVGSHKKLVSASGNATGWFHGTDFNLEGNYRLKLPVIGTIGAQGVLSSQGYAICGTYGFITEGIGTSNWVDPPEDLGGCDFMPFKVGPPASAAIATAGRTVRIAPGQDVVALAVRGSTGAPRVRIAGPRGAHFRTPAGAHPLKTTSAIIIPVDALRTTYVYLHRPLAGPWRLTLLPHSPSITRIATAHHLPEVHVRARVTVLRSGKVRVRWQATPAPGQRIALLDRTRGAAATIQRPTTRHSGTITYTPAGPLTAHRIEADISRNGQPRAQLVIKRFRLHSG